MPIALSYCSQDTQNANIKKESAKLLYALTTVQVYPKTSLFQHTSPKIITQTKIVILYIRI